MSKKAIFVILTIISTLVLALVVEEKTIEIEKPMSNAELVATLNESELKDITNMKIVVNIYSLQEAEKALKEFKQYPGESKELTAARRDVLQSKVNSHKEKVSFLGVYKSKNSFVFSTIGIVMIFMLANFTASLVKTP